jgi:hypothetical protein
MPDVTAGQHFRDAKPMLFGHPADWVVDEIFIETDGKEHAHVYSASVPHERNIVSTAILRDKRRFTPVQAQGR